MKKAQSRARLSARRPYWTALMVGVTMLLVAGTVRAASGSETRVVHDKLVFGVGSYLSDFKTDAAVGSGQAFGTLIRAEEQLGVEDDKSMLRIDGFYRIKSRQSIGFGFWSLNREGVATIDEQIEFKDNLYDIGAELESELDSSWLRVDWRYSLLQTDRGEAGFSAGLSSYRFEVALEGEATISDGTGGTTLARVRAEEDVIAPVPTIGIFINYALKPRLLLRFKAEYLDLEVGDLEGTLTDTAFFIEWYFSRRAGFGIGTNTTDIEVRNAGEDPYSFDYRQSGLLAYFTFAF